MDVFPESTDAELRAMDDCGDMFAYQIALCDLVKTHFDLSAGAPSFQLQPEAQRAFLAAFHASKWQPLAANPLRPPYYTDESLISQAYRTARRIRLNARVPPKRPIGALFPRTGEAATAPPPAEGVRQGRRGHITTLDASNALAVLSASASSSSSSRETKEPPLPPNVFDPNNIDPAAWQNYMEATSRSSVQLQPVLAASASSSSSSRETKEPPLPPYEFDPYNTDPGAWDKYMDHTSRSCLEALAGCGLSPSSPAPPFSTSSSSSSSSGQAPLADPSVWDPATFDPTFPREEDGERKTCCDESTQTRWICRVHGKQLALLPIWQCSQCDLAGLEAPCANLACPRPQDRCQFKCAACKDHLPRYCVSYHGRACQRADWGRHKLVCRSRPHRVHRPSVFPDIRLLRNLPDGVRSFPGVADYPIAITPALHAYANLMACVRDTPGDDFHALCNRAKDT
jgi:hypothetical protein